jgi:hypothetical protein
MARSSKKLPKVVRSNAPKVSKADPAAAAMLVAGSAKRKKKGSSWKRVGEKRGWRTRKPALAAGGSSGEAVQESGMIGACELHPARAG